MCINTLRQDTNENIFTSLNEGNIKTYFSNPENYIEFIELNYDIDYHYIYDLISIPNVLSKNGINIIILQRKIIIIQEDNKETKIDDINILCSNISEIDNLLDKTRDNILLLKNDKYYYPIIMLTKK